MKWILRLFGLLVTVLIIGGVLGYLYIETIIVSEAEKVASQELGVPVSVGMMSIGWLNKSVTVRNIKIANPEGFETPYFVKVPRVDVQLSDKILSNPVVIDSIHVNGLTAYYEVNPVKGNNLRKIQSNLLKSSKSKPSSTASGKEGKKKGLIILDLKITDSVLVPAISIAGQDIKQSVPIPLIHLQNIGSEKNPATSREVILRVMTSLTGVIQNSALPKLIINQVSEEAIKQIDNAKEAIGGMINGLFGK